MGEGGVGKSCLIKRYCEEKFVPKYISTIGVDYGVKKVTVDGRLVKVNFWDLAGHPEFFEVRNEFYKDTQGAILVFDITSKRSFEALEMWHKEFTRYSGGKKSVVFVVGNKTDLGGKSRVINESEAKAWAVSHGFKYYETSAANGDGVKDMFNALFGEVLTASESTRRKL
jgi:DnaJ homolog subfamily C member 27